MIRQASQFMMCWTQEYLKREHKTNQLKNVSLNVIFILFLATKRSVP